MQLPIFTRHFRGMEPLRTTLLERKAELLLALELHSGQSGAASGADRLCRVLSGKLSRIEEALHRIDAGHFGDCIICGDAIPEERLRLLPWETHCAACKQNQLLQSAVPAENPTSESSMMLLPIPKSA